MNSKTNTFQVRSKAYTAGIVFSVQTRRCVEAAPIIKWAEGWDFDDFKNYCKRVGLEIVRVPDGPKERAEAS